MDRSFPFGGTSSQLLLRLTRWSAAGVGSYGTWDLEPSPNDRCVQPSGSGGVPDSSVRNDFYRSRFVLVMKVATQIDRGLLRLIDLGV